MAWSVTLGDVSLAGGLMNSPMSAPRDIDGVARLAKAGVGIVVSAPIWTDSDTATPPQHTEPVRLPVGTVWPAVSAGISPDQFARIHQPAIDQGVPVMATVSGTTVDGYVDVAEQLNETAADIVQLDFAATNDSDGRSFGYQWDLMEAAIIAVREVVDRPVGARIPVMFEINSVETLSLMALRTQVDFVATITPLRIGLVPASAGGMSTNPGQLSGAAVKPLGLAEVRLYHELLRSHVPLVGDGGIETGADVLAYLLAGASAVQIGAAYQHDGDAVFGRLAHELDAALADVGHEADELVGALR